jgi:hypothetical protein
MLRAEKELEKGTNALIRKAEKLDVQEDRKYGKSTWAASSRKNRDKSRAAAKNPAVPQGDGGG